jgi:hypothetical protein
MSQPPPKKRHARGRQLRDLSAEEIAEVRAFFHTGGKLVAAKAAFPHVALTAINQISVATPRPWKIKPEPAKGKSPKATNATAFGVAERARRAALAIRAEALRAEAAALIAARPSEAPLQPTKAFDPPDWRAFVDMAAKRKTLQAARDHRRRSAEIERSFVAVTARGFEDELA